MVHNWDLTLHLFSHKHLEIGKNIKQYTLSNISIFVCKGLELHGIYFPLEKWENNVLGYNGNILRFSSQKLNVSWNDRWSLMYTLSVWVTDLEHFQDEYE